MPELAERIEALGITAAELAAIIRREPKEVATWVAGDAEPDAEARVLLRVLDHDHVAGLAVERVRTLRTLPLRGEGMAAAGVEHTAAEPVQTGGAI